MSEDKVTRRSYLKYIGAAVAVGAVAAAGYGAYQYSQPALTTPKPTQTTPSPSQTLTSSPGGKKLKVKLGGTKPLTGSVALAGQYENNGLQIWMDEVNKAGGIKGGDGNIYDVELIIYNDESKPENVVRFYEKLINEDKVDFLFGPVYGPLGTATLAVVEKYKKVEFFGTSTYDPEVLKDAKYIVHTASNGTEYLKIIVDMIANEVVPKDPEGKNIAIIHTDDIFGNISGTYGVEYAKKKLNVVYTEKFPANPTDLTPVLTRVKEAKPAALLNPGAGETVLLAKQCKEINLDLKLLCPGTFAVQNEFYQQMQAKYAEDIVSITQWEPGIVYPVNYGLTHDEFVSAYRKKTNADPVYSAAIGYIQGLALQASMEKSQQPLNSDSVRQAANTLDFTAVYGKWKIDPITGFQIGHEMAVVQWQDGKKMCVYPSAAANATLRYPMKKWSER